MPDQTPETSTTEAPAVEATEGATPDQAEPQLEDAGKKALDAERKARRDAEKAAKAVTAELDALRKQSMSDTDRAVAEARDAGRAEALAEVAADRVSDAVRVAAAGRSVDVDALLEGLDRGRFVSDGQPDREAIQEWVDRVAPATEQTPQPVDLGQGVRSTMPLNGDGIENSLKQALGIS